MQKLIDDIVRWHKDAFKDCSLESQLLKLDEELKEVVECQRAGQKEQSYDELADVFIVSVVLKHRFNSTIGAYFIGLIDDFPPDRAMERVKKKLEINKKRKWEKVNGVWKHKAD